MELKWLEDFVCLANIGSFWKASEERHVSQPAFSRRIRALEDWLGVTLIDRSSYPVTLTPYGRQFLPYAQDILKTSKSVREEFRLLAGSRADEIRIATLHTLSLGLVPELIEALVAAYPAAKAVVIPSIQGVENHFDALANAIVHLLVTYGDDGVTAASIGHLDGLEECTLATDEMVPVASAALARRLRLRDLKSAKSPVPFLAYSSFSFSEKLVAPLVRALGDRLKVVCEGGLSEGLAVLARRGMGVAWLPVQTIAEDLASKELIVVGGAEYRVPLTIKAYRMKTVRAPVLEAMWSLLAARAAS
ncbi:MAG TPA: LysR substrate-binding domain-containing protein [Burkholderiales bacterium]|jgi:DNA-binding transcriptional LysR family regulator|nr:LysR substrate-binding domain-containing protein [Burkholderiales bacterium]